VISFASPLEGKFESVDPSPSKDVAVTTPIIEDPPDTTLIPPVATNDVAVRIPVITELPRTSSSDLGVTLLIPTLSSFNLASSK